jgi:hypothetical protein
MTASVHLVASAAFVGSELMAEFGPLPPAFLPLGNRRLFARQFAELGGGARRRLLSIPEGFAADAADQRWLAKAGVELVPVPPGLSVGRSLAHVLEATGSIGQSVSILYGDTLLRGLDLEAADVAAVSPAAPDLYEWGHVRVAEQRLLPASEPGGEPAILTGFFTIADTQAFVAAVTRQGGDIVRAVTDYAAAKPVRAHRAPEWLDFGHATTYHRSRRLVSTARAFNRLTNDRRAIVKSGEPPDKIEAEARWFETLPPPLRLHTPAFLGRVPAGDSGAGYALEYLSLPTLADLYVFGRLAPGTWARILDACDEVLCRFAAHRADDATLTDGDYLGKTMARLDEHARVNGLDTTAPCRLNGRPLPSLASIAETAAAAIPPMPPLGITRVHGDFCFSNLLYDMRAEAVKAIDPRGRDMRERITAGGDPRYDIAKLHHSAIGLYDHIVGGQFRLRRDGALDFELELPDSPTIRTVQALFRQRRFAGLDAEAAAALPLSVLLFLAMPPLHAEDAERQAALLANALRLFLLLDQGGRGTA